MFCSVHVLIGFWPKASCYSYLILLLMHLSYVHVQNAILELNGPAYVFTSNVVRPLLKQVEIYKTPWLLWKDTFVVGVLRNLSNIPLYNVKGLVHAPCSTVQGNPATDQRISYHRVHREKHIDLFNNKSCMKRASGAKSKASVLVSRQSPSRVHIRASHTT